MKLKQELIKRLQDEPTCIVHTKKPEDLPLLREVLKAAAPNDEGNINKDCKCFTVTNKGVWLQYNDNALKLHEIPLHDFLDESKTAREWFESVEEPELRKALLENMEDGSIECIDIWDAINKMKSFKVWSSTKQRLSVWRDCYNKKSFIPFYKWLSNHQKEKSISDKLRDLANEIDELLKSNP